MNKTRLQRLPGRRPLLGAFISIVLLSTVASDVGIAQKTDVPWLKEVVTAPAIIPDADRGYFAPLLEDAEGHPIQSLEQWKVKREQLRAAWLDFLGPMPRQRPEVQLTILSEDRDAGCLRQLVAYEAEADQTVQGYLLMPLGSESKRLPGIVALHPTSDLHIEEIAGLKGKSSAHLGPQLARRGFVVFCPLNFLWHEATDYQHAVARFKARHPDTLGMHKMLFDAMRAVDVLKSLPNVDASRIGCVGHSLGAKEVLYLTAFDDRIRAAVASEGGMGFTFTNWHAPWYLGPAIHAEDFPLNHHQLVALIAPRPFLVLAGGTDEPGCADGDQSWPYLTAAHPVCRFYEKPIRLGLDNHGEGHTVSQESFERMAEWLETYLAR